MMLDLMSFCSTNDARQMLVKPFSRGDFTYAGCGTLILRVPRSSRWPLDTGPEWPSKETVLSFSNAGLIKVDLIKPILWKYETCDECYARPVPMDGCTECHGTGWVLQNYPVRQLTGFNLNQIIIYKISELPELCVYLPPAKAVPAAKDYLGFFEFDGGCGHFMGMRN